MSHWGPLQGQIRKDFGNDFGNEFGNEFGNDFGNDFGNMSTSHLNKKELPSMTSGTKD